MKTFKHRWGLYPLLLMAALLWGCTTTQTPNAQIEDAKITTQVKSKLAADTRLSTLANVSVTTTNRVVTLTGEVESEATKRAVLDVARDVSGVEKVIDALQVQQAQLAGGK